MIKQVEQDLLGENFSMAQAQPYMDIYQSSVDPAIREIERQTQRNLMGDSASAVEQELLVDQDKV